MTLKKTENTFSSIYKIAFRFEERLVNLVRGRESALLVYLYY